MGRMVRFSWMVGVFLTVLTFGLGASGQQRAGSAKPISAKKLGTFLKNLPGWKAEGPPEGGLVKTSKGTYSESTRYHIKGVKELEVTLTDGAHVPLAYEEYEDWKEEIGSEGPDIVKAIKVAGHPALEIYEPDFETATLIVLVKKRLVLYMEIDEAGPKDDLKPLANQLDWKGIAGLVQSDK